MVLRVLQKDIQHMSRELQPKFQAAELPETCALGSRSWTLEQWHSRWSNREGRQKHMRVGADLVLEMCRRQLSNSTMQEREDVDMFMTTVPEAASAWKYRVAHLGP